jgi:predicted MFS family arabinose efflux permease
LLAVGAGSFLVMAAAPVLPVFVAGSLTGLATMAMAVPLLTQMYQDNYPAAERGKLFSRSVMVRVATAALFAELAGRWLAVDWAGSRWLLVIYAVACACGAGLLARCPSQPLTPAGSAHPWRALRFVREDRVFRLTLICWMLMGFANLMMWPMRVEYLANPRYGLALSAATIALLTGVIPNTARLVLSPVWGWLFDRMNFFVLRVLLNLSFALGILTFFTSSSLTGLVLGAIVFGIANAGGDVAWTLWVTKFAPADRVADYMSVHTFFTGLRGIAAPLVVFQLVGVLSVATIGWISAGMIVAASLILMTEVRARRAPDPGTPVVERSARP